MNSILNKKQKLFLNLFAGNVSLSDKFYLTGGTALCEYYIPYRFSEDLDFFSEQEINPKEIIVFLESTKKQLGYRTFEYNTSFNRNLFFLKFSHEELKLEFTYFPFAQIQKPITKQGIKIDSVQDIAINKLFTIYQKPRARDFLDLYMICQKYDFSIKDLIAKAKIKFDTHLDLLNLGSQFLKANELKDYPRLIKPLNDKLWRDFFQKQAEKLGKEIIS